MLFVFFETFNFDAVTVAPYMGSDSITPFFEFKNKWVILLALTSNTGSSDFQHTLLGSGNVKLFEFVLEKSQSWGNDQNMMYVAGATQPGEFSRIRKIIPNHFLLVPGVGTQGGSLEEVSKNGMNNECGILVNSSRGIIYSSSEKNFGILARKSAQTIQESMQKYLELYCK